MIKKVWCEFFAFILVLFLTSSGVYAQQGQTVILGTYNGTTITRIKTASDGSLILSGTITGGNGAAGNTGAAVPSQAGYTGVDIGGNLIGVTGTIIDTSRALDVNVVGGSVGNPAAGPIGDPVPDDGSYVGLNVSGNLRGQTGTNVSGSIYAADTNISSFPVIVYNSTQPTLTNAQTETDYQITSRGALIVNPGVESFNVVISAGSSVIGHVITDSGSTSVIAGIVPLTGATNLGKAVDSAAGSTDTGVAGLCIRDDSLSTLTPVDGDYVNCRTNSTGAIWVQSSVQDAAEGAAVSSNPVPVGGVYRTTLVTLDAGDVGYPLVDVNSRLFVVPTPGIQGGWSVLNATGADGATACTNTAQAVKASQGTLGGWYLNNPNTADSYLQIYNVASGSVTVGTTNPLMTIHIPGAAANSVAANVEFGNGIQFSTAIAIACTTTAGGNTAPSSALDVNLLFK